MKLSFKCIVHVLCIGAHLSIITHSLTDESLFWMIKENNILGAKSTSHPVLGRSVGSRYGKQQNAGT